MGEKLTTYFKEFKLHATWHEISLSQQDILPAGMNALLANAECRNLFKSIALKFPQKDH